MVVVSLQPSKGQIVSSMWAARMLFISFMCVIAFFSSYAAHYLIRNSEMQLATNQYDLIAEHSLDLTRKITTQQRHAVRSLATIYANAFPETNQWPYVYLDGYNSIADALMLTSSGNALLFTPLVKPEQQTQYEEYIYQKIEQDHPPGYGVSSFGRGIFAIDDSTNERYHDNSSILAPIVQVTKPFIEVLLMFNGHSRPGRGRTIDSVIACSTQRAERYQKIQKQTGDDDFRTVEASLRGDTAQSENATTAAMRMLAASPCSVLGDTIHIRGVLEAAVIEPIYPKHNPTELVGLIGTNIIWSKLLTNVFARQVTGIDIVLESVSSVHTFTVSNGQVTVRGNGDLHDTKFDAYRRSQTLSESDSVDDNIEQYTVHLYPNEHLFASYSTSNPFIGQVGAVFIFVIVSLLFALYDFFVNKERMESLAIIKAKRQFVRYISHEVRTPLNTVCMGLRLLLDEMDSTTTVNSNPDASYVSAWRTLLNEILMNSGNAVDVLNDLLNYDKIEMGLLKLELTDVSMIPLIERAANEFHRQAKKANVNFLLDISMMEYETKSEEHRTVGDPIRLTQVLRNLLSNALKFTPEHGSITIKVAKCPREKESSEPSVTSSSTKTFTLISGEEVAYPQNGMLQLTVTDTGAGMSEEQVSQLFGEGVQFNVNELQSGQGSGLGLYIAKGIVEEHGGSLTVSSEGLGRGTVFTMLIPLYQIPSTSKQPTPMSSRHSSKTDLASNNEHHEPAGMLNCLPNDVVNMTPTSRMNHSSIDNEEPKPRVLVVDDALSNRKMLIRILTSKGYVCDGSQNGREAVLKYEEEKQKLMDLNSRLNGTVDVVEESIRSEPYDTILMDYEMPVLNGPAATKQLRDMGCTCLIVGITGNVLPEDVKHFKACGAQAVLPKPLKFMDLETIWSQYSGLDCDANTIRNYANANSQKVDTL